MMGEVGWSERIEKGHSLSTTSVVPSQEGGGQTQKWWESTFVLCFFKRWRGHIIKVGGGHFKGFF